MPRTCVVLALILSTPVFFLRGGAFLPPWNWCLLSTTFVPGWMDNGQRVFLEVILTRRKSQPHLLISILWGSVSLSATGCHVHGQASVRPDVNDGHMRVARVCSWPCTPGVLRVAAGDLGNRPRLWKWAPQSPHSLALFSLTWTEGLFLFIYLFFLST